MENNLSPEQKASGQGTAGSKPALDINEPRKEKKKGKGKIIFLTIILLLVGGAVYAAGLSGFVPVISPMLGADKPRDLGVVSTLDDYKAAAQATAFTLDNSAGKGPDTRISYSAKKKTINGKFSQSQISSLINFNHSDSYPVSGAQIRVHADGTMEGAAMVNVNGYKGYDFHNAVYVKGKVNVTSPQSLSFDVSAVEVGRLPVPINPTVKQVVEDAVNEKLRSITGLAIESVGYEEGKIDFKGTIPESAKRVKR